MTNTLNLYEIILLILGVLLFLLLAAAFVYQIFKQQPVKKLLYFFFFPIIMIAYPSIKGIKSEFFEVSINSSIDQLIENPNDTVARENLISSAEQLEEMDLSIEEKKKLGEIYLLLQEPEKALDIAEEEIETREEQSLPEEELEQYDYDWFIDLKNIATLQQDNQNSENSSRELKLISDGE
ncbi:MAG: hypothetical protein QNK23_13960 [Crocinitomicaceae bacterium]|nr:hypothetical protein [Crocinitomicaceae bacterium]